MSRDRVHYPSRIPHWLTYAVHWYAKRTRCRYGHSSLDHDGRTCAGCGQILFFA